ncbi:transporter substrate-binding domain-containing protein [Desulfovibrio sp. OttesenSCG-928-A18]|nr:transporter substrate-binding domain-containing protein [Desulfovibrio sp. OttesenSCG-928-A18]
MLQKFMRRFTRSAPPGRGMSPGAALILALGLCCVLFVPRPEPAFAAQPMRVVYGFDREFPPFTYEDAGGVAVGFEIELVQAIFHDTGATLVFRPLNWERIEYELSAGDINLTSGMIRTRQREQLYLFSEQPSFPLQIRLFTKVYNRFPSALLLRGQPVSVEQGTYQHRLLQEIGGFNIKPFTRRTDGLRALFNDEVAAYCAPVQNSYYYINKLNYGAITTVGTPLGITNMRIAVNRDRGDLKRMVDEGLKRVRESGEYDRLYRKWFVRELEEGERRILVEAATRAAVPAYAPYGKSGRGAALLTATGKIYSACTMENADLSLSLSAMRAAVAKAVSEGEFELRAAVLVDPKGLILSPGAEDLQTLFEFGRGVLVLMPPDEQKSATSMVVELLPAPVRRESSLVPAY